MVIITTVNGILYALTAVETGCYAFVSRNGAAPCSCVLPAECFVRIYTRSTVTNTIAKRVRWSSRACRAVWFVGVEWAVEAGARACGRSGTRIAGVSSAASCSLGKRVSLIVSTVGRTTVRTVDSHACIGDDAKTRLGLIGPFASGVASWRIVADIYLSSPGWACSRHASTTHA